MTTPNPLVACADGCGRPAVGVRLSYLNLGYVPVCHPCAEARLTEVGPTEQLDLLVNVHGWDQLTATQALWAPHLLDGTDPPVTDPGPDAPLADQLVWAGWRGREIARVGLADVLAWLRRALPSGVVSP